jgi:transporter family protein
LTAVVLFLWKCIICIAISSYPLSLSSISQSPVCIKKGSAYINPIVGAVVLQFVAALLGTILLVVIWITQDKAPYFTAEGLLWAALAGVSVGAAELLSFGVSGMGVPASQSIPILIGGSVAFGAVLGIVLLGEELVAQGWSGVVILMVGIGLVATDPGKKVEGH